MKNYILPIPFSLSPYDANCADIYNRILNTSGASQKASQHFPDNLLLKNAELLQPVSFSKSESVTNTEALYLSSAKEMQINTGKAIASISNDLKQLLVIGGDHAISIGTGYGLSQFLDLSQVGLIWIDAHGDCNIPATSASKSITGYPVAVNCGLGLEELVQPFKSNFIDKVVYIGLRDVEEQEANIMQKFNHKAFSNLDIIDLGLQKILQQCQDFLSDKKYLWLSIDIDSLDPIYLQENEIDLPVSGGLTPRELLFITNKIASSGKLLVTEITQINNIGRDTNITALASRIAELSFNLGSFRYGKPIS